jgi:hypothetical protein
MLAAVIWICAVSVIPMFASRPTSPPLMSWSPTAYLLIHLRTSRAHLSCSVLFVLVSGGIQMTTMSLDDRRDRIDRRKPEHLWSQVAADIRADIDAGRLVPGDKLPGELELAVQYGVARLTVRHAVADLTENGYVVVLRGRGTFVAERA